MKIESMRVEVALAQSIDKKKSYAAIGGFAFKYADGSNANFDFEDSEGWLQPKGDRVVFELTNLDRDCSSVPGDMTAEEFVCPVEVVEFYHEFLKDSTKDTSIVPMTDILWWTFGIDGREYNVPRDVLQQYNCLELESINSTVKEEMV